MGRSSCCHSRFGTKFDSKKWLSLDSCGIVCLTFSFSIHLFALYEISAHLLSIHPVISGIIFGVLYLPSFFLALSSLFMAWTSNPGAVPMGARPIPLEEGSEDMESGTLKRRRGVRRCHKCDDNFKPPRAHHDSVTGRCVVKMDHYCPWVCNAVGALNHKFFFLFIFYTAIASLASIVLILLRAVPCGFQFDPDRWSNSTDVGTGTGVTAIPECDDHDLEILILFIVSVVFLFFTICMLAEQVEVIQKGTSKIARMKISAGVSDEAEFGRVTSQFNEMFGGDLPRVAWHWFLPIPVRFPNDLLREKVLGYRYDPTFGDTPYRPSEEDLKEENGERKLNNTPCDIALGSPRDPQPPLYESNGDAGEEQHNTDGRVQLPNEGTREVTDTTLDLNIEILPSTRVKRRSSRNDISQEEKIALLKSD